MESYTITVAALAHYAEAPAHFEQLLGRLTHEATQRVTHSALEDVVQAAGNELLCRMILGYFDQRGAEAPIHARVVGEDGIVRIHRRKGGKRNLEPCFGGVVITRRGYGGRGVKSVFPLDAELNLSPDQCSHGWRDVLVEQVVRGSFDEAVGQLEGSGGGQMAKRQAEEVVVHLSQDFDTLVMIRREHGPKWLGRYWFSKRPGRS